MEADREARFRDRMLGPVAGTYVFIEVLLSLLVAYENRWKKRSWGTAANLTESFYTGL